MNNRLRGTQKQKRDKWLKVYANEHPQATQTDIAHAFGVSQSVVSLIIKKIRTEKKE